MEFDQLKDLPSPYYRVAVKCLIYNEAGELLVLESVNDDIEIPGGGWEHGETFLDCLQREVQEELGIIVREISSEHFYYTSLDRRGYLSLRIAAHVTPDNFDFKPGDDMVAWQAVSRDEFEDQRADHSLGQIAEKFCVQLNASIGNFELVSRRKPIDKPRLWI